MECAKNQIFIYFFDSCIHHLGNIVKKDALCIQSKITGLVIALE